MYFVEADCKANVPAVFTNPKMKVKTKYIPISGLGGGGSRVWGILTRNSRNTTLIRVDMTI